MAAATRSKRNACSAQRDHQSHLTNSRLYEDLKGKFVGTWSPTTIGATLANTARRSSDQQLAMLGALSYLTGLIAMRSTSFMRACIGRRRDVQALGVATTRFLIN